MQIGEHIVQECCWQDKRKLMLTITKKNFTLIIAINKSEISHLGLQLVSF